MLLHRRTLRPAVVIRLLVQWCRVPTRPKVSPQLLIPRTVLNIVPCRLVGRKKLVAKAFRGIFMACENNRVRPAAGSIFKRRCS